MDQKRTNVAAKLTTFGRRKVAPRVCVADSKQHIRIFLGEALEELGFITCATEQVNELGTLLDAQLPDLVVLGLSGGGIAAGEMLKVLANKEFQGKVLLLGPRDSYVVEAVRELGNELGIAMLPTLVTPFRSEGLRDSVAVSCRPTRRKTPRLTRPKPYTRAGSNFGTSQRSARKRSSCGKPRRSFAFVIRPGESCRRHISYRMTVILTSESCRSLSLRRQLMIGAISFPSTVPWRSQSTCQLHFFRIRSQSSGCTNRCRIIPLSKG
jgi:hypothetical protein